ncbi:MAG: hypothetical protein ACI90V_013774, partial [Bacillariaceae sp.]
LVVSNQHDVLKGGKRYCYAQSMFQSALFDESNI